VGVRGRAFPRGEPDAAAAKVLHLVGAGKRVLVLGSGEGPLQRALREQDCDTATVAVTAGDWTLAAMAAEETVDVVVIAGVLEHQRDPLAVLHGVRKYLRKGGYIVALVPNVAHGSVRLALLAGRFPFGEEGGFREVPSRFFTYDSLVNLFEEAELAVAVVERQEEDVQVPDGVASNALELITGADVRTAWFIAAAYPLPWDGLGWLQVRLRELIEQQAAARNEAEDLRQDLDAVKGHLCLLIEQQEKSVRRENQVRAQLLACHQQLLQRDEELHDETAKRQVAEERLAWIRRSVAGRIYRLARRALTLGRQSTSR
jgi:SAM-dependent methyltransferase